VKRTIGVLVVLVAAVSGCGGDDGVTVEGAWARTSPAMTTAGAVYMQITASEADRLVGASVPASVAAVTEIHETVMAGGDMGGETDTTGGMGGEMTMQPVGALDLPAGETVSLQPGGYHIMLLDLAEPLETGRTFEVTLVFENAGERAVEVEVRDQAP
jgi:copper(I)-binding protein